jgi:acetylglutamate kinase
MQDAIHRAETLMEAFEYIQQFRGKIIVIKLGGSAMEEPAALTATLRSILFLEAVGIRPVVVHGGGKPIDRAMAASGIVPRKVLGRRYTDSQTLDIVVKVLKEEINQGIVRQMQSLGGKAIGVVETLSGAKLTLKDEAGSEVDLGRVGEVVQVDAEKHSHHSLPGRGWRRLAQRQCRYGCCCGGNGTQGREVDSADGHAGDSSEPKRRKLAPVHSKQSGE